MGMPRGSKIGVQLRRIFEWREVIILIIKWCATTDKEDLSTRKAC
jgi:hypothetical protein